MRKVLTFLSTIIAAVFIGALVEIGMVDWLKEKGYYEWHWVETVMSWLSNIAASQSFHLMAVAFFGVTIGLWLDAFAKNFDNRRTENVADLGAKLAKCGRTLTELDRTIWKNNGRLPDIPEIEGYVHELQSMNISLTKLGVQCPDVSFEADPVGYLSRMGKFASKIAPLLKDGHMSEARKASKLLAKEIEVTAPTIASDQRLLPPSTATERQR